MLLFGPSRRVFGASATQGADYYGDIVVRYLVPGYLNYIGLPHLDAEQFRGFVVERIQYFLDAQAALGRTPTPAEIWRWINGAVVYGLREKAYEIARSKNESGDLMRQWSNAESAHPEIRRLVPSQMVRSQTSTMADKGAGSDVFSAGLTGGTMGDRRYLASLALRERRAGRDPGRVLAAAVSKTAEFDVGETSGIASYMDYARSIIDGYMSAHPEVHRPQHRWYRVLEMISGNIARALRSGVPDGEIRAYITAYIMSVLSEWKPDVFDPMLPDTKYYKGYWEYPFNKD